MTNSINGNDWTDICVIFSKKLPYDILRKIYVEYFHIKYKYDEMKTVLFSLPCQHLEYSGCVKLSKYLKTIFNPHDARLLNYSLKHSDEEGDHFKILFKKYIIDKNISFPNYPYYEGMAMMWMFMLYK